MVAWQVPFEVAPEIVSGRDWAVRGAGVTMLLTLIVLSRMRPDTWVALPAATSLTLVSTALVIVPEWAMNSCGMRPERISTSELKGTVRLFWSLLPCSLPPPAASERRLTCPLAPAQPEHAISVSTKNARGPYPVVWSRYGLAGSRGPAVISPPHAPS